jgi:hypothetical protein
MAEEQPEGNSVGSEQHHSGRERALERDERALELLEHREQADHDEEQVHPECQVVGLHHLEPVPET